jgi:hypothetical protein
VAFEPPLETRRQAGVELDGDHPPGGAPQRLGQPAAAGADLDHQLGGKHAGSRHQLVGQTLAAQKMLSVSATAARLRGHGSSP